MEFQFVLLTFLHILHTLFDTLLIDLMDILMVMSKFSLFKPGLLIALITLMPTNAHFIDCAEENKSLFHIFMNTDKKMILLFYCRIYFLGTPVSSSVCNTV